MVKVGGCHVERRQSGRPPDISLALTLSASAQIQGCTGTGLSLSCDISNLGHRLLGRRAASHSHRNTSSRNRPACLARLGCARKASAILCGAIVLLQYVTSFYACNTVNVDCRCRYQCKWERGVLFCGKPYCTPLRFVLSTACGGKDGASRSGSVKGSAV